MKWEIDKSFNFAYGHRVWSQTLDSNYTGKAGACLACRHLHGHEGLVKVHLAANYLQNGMVVDFKMLGWFKDFIDETVDHKFIMDINDPLITYEVPELCYFKIDSNNNVESVLKQLAFNKCIHHDENYWVPDLSQLQDMPQYVIEKYEGMVFVDFVPTSENLCAWFLDILHKKMSMINVDVVAVEFWESPKSHCRVDI